MPLLGRFSRNGGRVQKCPVRFAVLQPTLLLQDPEDCATPSGVAIAGGPLTPGCAGAPRPWPTVCDAFGVEEPVSVCASLASLVENVATTRRRQEEFQIVAQTFQQQAPVPKSWARTARYSRNAKAWSGEVSLTTIIPEPADPWRPRERTHGHARQVHGRGHVRYVPVTPRSPPIGPRSPCQPLGRSAAACSS